MRTIEAEAPGLNRQSAVTALREATLASHHRVDNAFSAYDLTDRTSYGRFLLAHAAAAAAAEAVLRDDLTLPAWRPRLPLLIADLARLGIGAPLPLPFAAEDDQAWRCGVLYVLEGSRLGASVLIGRIDASLPAVYLASRHRPGEWRGLLQAIDAFGSARGQSWTDAAIIGALACFELFERAPLTLQAGAPAQINNNAALAAEVRQRHRSRTLQKGRQPATA